MAGTMENPWNVGNIDEFLYFCCPECDLKDQSKTNFLQHALDQHPKANEYVNQLNSFMVKEEPYEDDPTSYGSPTDDIDNDNSYGNDYDYDSIDMKCEVKLETKEHGNYDNLTSEKSTNKSSSGGSKKCDQCDRVYKKTQQLRQHIERDHEGIRHKCDLCEKSFSLAGSLFFIIESSI